MNEPGIIRFICEGRSLTLRPGRVSPGQPSEHIADAAGKHISLAYREQNNSVLFDMAETDGTRAGYRVNLSDLLVFRFPSKTEYWKARTAAGWPARRKARV